jgi:iron complex outermembrane receptor protein
MAASIGLLTKYVGKQYIDNTTNEDASLLPYFYNDLLLSYSYTGLPYVKEIRVNFNVHNLLGAEYVSNAWVYRFSSDNYDPTGDDPYSRSEETTGYYNLTGLYPQAGRYFMLGLNVTF